MRDDLFNRELADVDKAFQLGGRESFKVLGRKVCKRLGEEDIRVVISASIDLNLLVAISTIFAAVGPSPMVFGTTAH